MSDHAALLLRKQLRGAPPDSDRVNSVSSVSLEFVDILHIPVASQRCCQLIHTDQNCLFRMMSLPCRYLLSQLWRTSLETVSCIDTR